MMANGLPPGKTVVVDEVDHTLMSRETSVMEATKRRRTVAVCEVDCHRPMAIEAKVVSVLLAIYRQLLVPAVCLNQDIYCRGVRVGVPFHRVYEVGVRRYTHYRSPYICSSLMEVLIVVFETFSSYIVAYIII